MKKILLFLLGFTTPIFANFTNLIVFGDSLSDNGNFPETAHIWINANAKRTVTNLTPQFYVPFTNPVVIDSISFTVPNTQKQFPWPILNPKYLATQTKINNQERWYRSISWPQFFLTMANTEHLTNSILIIPSEIINNKAAPKNASVNYAWGFAASNDHCLNHYYTPIHSCDDNSIRAARQNYIRNPDKKNYTEMQIPNLHMQVKLFLSDQKNNRVTADNKTLYSFWIGGNDLIIAYIDLLKHWNPLPGLGYFFGTVAFHVIYNVSFLVSHLPANQRPDHVYVFEFFNPEYTPAFTGKTAGKTLMITNEFSNFWLRFDVMIYNLFSHTKIVVVHSCNLFKESTKTEYFKEQNGKACILSDSNYFSATSIPKTNCKGYMFWNALHPSTEMNEVIAYHFLKIIEQW